jgi:hypothetical protein
VSERSKPFGNFRIDRSEDLPVELEPERSWLRDSVTITAVLAALAVICVMVYGMGINSVMRECQAGAGRWLVVIQHGDMTIDCKRDKE